MAKKKAPPPKLKPAAKKPGAKAKPAPSGFVPFAGRGPMSKFT